MNLDGKFGDRLLEITLCVSQQLTQLNDPLSSSTVSLHTHSKTTLTPVWPREAMHFTTYIVLFFHTTIFPSHLQEQVQL